VAEGPWYRELIETGAPVETFRQHLMFGRVLAEATQPAVPERLAA
jgi:hypothetical protein